MSRLLNVVCAVTILALISLPALAIDGDQDYIPGKTVSPDRIYVKVIPAVAPLDVHEFDSAPRTGLAPFDALLDAFKATKIEKAYPEVPPETDPTKVDLSRWYFVYFADGIDVRDAVAGFGKCPVLEYADYDLWHFPLEVPNDPRVGAQWWVAKCGFPGAWDVTHGIAEVVIGIVDSGIDMPFNDLGEWEIHEDLASNVWINRGEDINDDGQITLDDLNGVDDDGNGFDDDFYGVDFGARQMLPNDYWGDPARGENFSHGTHVSGLASAVTGNGVGVAGAGYSCKLMITAHGDINHGPQNGELGPLINTNQGITYCSRNGANVINMSFGSGRVAAPSPAERDAINAALGRGTILFAATGNDAEYNRRGDAGRHYPVAFDGVIGVAASDDNDHATNFTNYGDYTDLVAPGQGILSTLNHNRYEAADGTSMACPIATGLAALSLSQRMLDRNALLTKMQQTATDISDRNQDTPGIRYRINADFLVNSIYPRYAITEWTAVDVTGDGDGRAEPGETVACSFTIEDIAGFADARGAVVTLSSPDPVVTVVNASANLGHFGGGQQVFVGDNRALTFRVENCRPHYSSLVLTVNDSSEQARTYQMPITIGHPYFLLVDDDSSAAYQKYYVEDLAIRPIVHETWDVATQGEVPASVLEEFTAVIWETGTARAPLSVNEQGALQHYLDSGQKGLIISGQYIGASLNNNEFMLNYLHARYNSSTTNRRQAIGMADHVVSDSVSLFLLGAAGASNNFSQSLLSPVNGADTLFRWSNDGAPGATWFADNRYAVIYLGFALESASGMNNSTVRHIFLEKAIDELYRLPVEPESAPASPKSFGLSEAYPNPFNARTAISVTAPAGQGYFLEVVDLLGRRVALLNDGKAAGNRSFTWDGGSSPAGIYLFRLSWTGGSTVQKAALLK